jgi:hypothetical protein
MSRLQYCGLCDVYVGLVPDGRVVVVPGGVLHEVIADCERNGSPIPDEMVYDPVEWLQDATSESDEFAWIEDGVHGSWWYQLRGIGHHRSHRDWLLREVRNA